MNMKISRRQYKYAVRRLKRCEDKLKNEKFLNSLLENDGNFFQELRKLRGKSCNMSSCIDGQVGSENIANKFAENYKELYNMVELDAKFEEVHTAVQNSLNQQSLTRLD